MLPENWELPLLKKATPEPWVQGNEATQGIHNQELLSTAYRFCSSVTANHSRSFFLSSGFLPIRKRQAIRALYAFCRTTDDIVDTSFGPTDKQLSLWRDQESIGIPRPNDPVSLAWSVTKEHYRIPSKYALQLIDGVAQDLSVSRYEDFASLADYCYGVASTVGLMSMHIIGYNGQRAIPYAVKLGVALQLTNILRDIQEDWGNGRLYLPKEEMQAFGVTEQHIAQCINDRAWREFMKYQVQRANLIYEQAWPGIAMLNPTGRLAVAAAATFYRGILTKIEANNYDVFKGRAFVSQWGKVQQLPKLWVQYARTPSYELGNTITD
ncbi:MAG: phytoene/squalene synthase family protein [Bacteroidota bacterium]